MPFSQTAQASEIDLKIPLLDVEYNFWGHAVTGSQILLYGLIVCALGMLFGFYEFAKSKDACSQINAEHGVFNL